MEKNQGLCTKKESSYFLLIVRVVEKSPSGKKEWSPKSLELEKDKSK